MGYLVSKVQKCREILRAFKFECPHEAESRFTQILSVLEPRHLHMTNLKHLPGNTYRQKLKLAYKMTGSVSTQLHMPLIVSTKISSMSGSRNIGSTKSLQLKGYRPNHAKNLVICKIVSPWLGLIIPRPRGHS